MNLHLEQKAISLGADLADAEYAVLIIHGRNQTPEDIDSIVKAVSAKLKDLGHVGKVNFTMPKADSKTWYPNKFMEEKSSNEPMLSHALEVIDKYLTDFSNADIVEEKQVILGFSQGACLVAEYISQSTRRPKTVVILTGGVIGVEPNNKVDSPLEGTNVYISNGNKDDWVPLSRTVETAELFANAQANVTMKILPGREHEISTTELDDVSELIVKLV